MKNIHRLLAGFFCFCILFASLCGCGNEASVQSADSGFSIYATFYPFYAATQALTEGIDDVYVNCLVQPQDGCLRDYQLSDWDLALLNSANIVIAGGRGFESFESILYALGEDGPAISAVLYNMELVEQRAVNTQEDTQSHWLDSNPHIYMRTDGMSEILQRVANSLILLDEAHEALYLENLDKAQTELEIVTSEIAQTAEKFSNRSVIVLNEALVYVAQEYGLDMSVCYERESGEDLSGADLENCMNALSKSDATVILIEKQAPQKLCKALEDAGYHLAYLDVLSTKRVSEGFEGYLNAQRANMQAIETAFATADSAQ